MAGVLWALCKNSRRRTLPLRLYLRPADLLWTMLPREEQWRDIVSEPCLVGFNFAVWLRREKYSWSSVFCSEADQTPFFLYYNGTSFILNLHWSESGIHLYMLIWPYFQVQVGVPWTHQSQSPISLLSLDVKFLYRFECTHVVIVFYIFFRRWPRPLEQLLQQLGNSRYWQTLAFPL